MKRILLLTLILTLLLALTASATVTRVTTLGQVNNIIRDEANIVLFPSTILQFPNLVLGEVYDDPAITPQGEINQQWLYRVGAHYNLGETAGVLGLYLDRTPLLPDFGPYSSVDNRLNLFYGLPLEAMDLGAGLSFYRNSASVDGDPNDETETSFTSLQFIIGAGLMDNALELSASLGFDSWTDVNAAGDDVTEPKSNMDLGLAARYWWGFNDNVFLVPHLGFNLLSAGETDVATSTDLTEKTTAVDLGIGANVSPQNNILLLADLGFMLQSTTLEQGDNELGDSRLDFPYFKVGLEGQVTRWWDVRLGAIKRWAQTSMDVSVDPDIADKAGFAETETFLGSGFMFRNLTLDIWMNPDFLLNGPNFVSGYDSQLAYMASLRYAWGE